MQNCIFINSFFMIGSHSSHKNLLFLQSVYPRYKFDHLLISTLRGKHPES